MHGTYKNNHSERLGNSIEPRSKQFGISTCDTEGLENSGGVIGDDL